MTVQSRGLIKRERTVRESFSLGFTSKLRRNQNSKSIHAAAARERSALIRAGKYSEQEEKKICEKYSLSQFY